MYPLRTREFPQFSQAFRRRRGGGGAGGGAGGGGPPPPPQSFLSMYAFFWRALEVPFLKVVTKNVHEN